MRYPIEILTVEMDGDDGLIVTFSDGTTGAYVAEELLGLRPYRELTEPSAITLLRVQAGPPMHQDAPPRLQ